MTHILNNLTSDYDIDLALMERIVVRGELNLQFERLDMKSISNEEGEVWKNKLYLMTNSREMSKLWSG
jgi:hypothetical protein